MATITMYNSSNIDDVYYPIWVAVATGGTVGASATDPVNGATPWTARTLSESLNWNSCCFGDKQVVAVGGNNTNIGSSTYDGITWTDITLSASKSWKSVIYGNGHFVAVATNAVDTTVSEDGSIWVAGGNQNDSPGWSSIAYGNPSILGTPTPMFVVVADGGGVVASKSTDNGSSWARTTITAGNWRSVCYGNGKFVAVSYGSDKAVYSVDGETWQDATLPASRNWQHVCYGNGLFVTAAYGTNIAAWSSDGINWTEVLLPVTANWMCISYGTIQSATNQGLPVFTIISTGATTSVISYDGKVWASAIQRNATYTYQCYAPFPWNSGDTLSIQNNAVITVNTNQNKFWNAITATYGKLRIENTSDSVGNYFQMGRTSGVAACTLTVGSGLFDIEMQGNWISLEDGDNSAGQVFHAPFTEYIPMIEVETEVAGVYEQWLNVTGAFGPYNKIFGKDGLEWVGNGKRGNYFVQNPVANPIDIPTLTGGATTNGSYYITFDASSSILSVNPNLVLISPTAFPISSKLPTTSTETDLYTSSKAFASSPTAPVFLIILSTPVSTSSNVLIAKAPNPAITGVTVVLNV
jgi:hypothetical protein